MNASTPEIIFVGAIVSDEVCEQTPACSVAGNNFQRNFVLALGRATGAVPYVVSFVPTATYPRARTIKFSAGAEVLVPADLRVHYVSFINLPLLKQLTQGWGIFWAVAKRLWARRGRRCAVLVYNLASQHASPARWAARFLRARVVAIIADTPHDYYDFKGTRGLLQRVDMALQLRSVRHFDGIIPLTDAMGATFAPGVATLRVEGGVDDAEGVAEPKGSERVPSECICMFSGILNEINGIELLLGAMALIDEPSFRLWIFGRGPLEGLVRAATSADSRIEFGGFLPNHVVREHQRRASILINPRPSHREITRFTFPSKLLEYMLSGRPVVTTVLPGIPTEYHPYVFLLRDETPAGLAALLVDIGSRPRSELLEFGDRAREFVLQEKNWSRQGERVASFLGRL